MFSPVSFLGVLLALLSAPALFGVINRTKAVLAGRKGSPIFQAYLDVWKLLRKGAVYSGTTTWVFRLGPIVGLAATMMGLCLVPMFGQDACVSFEGDLLLFAGLIALMRFLTVVAALDTGSSFEGMGASREVFFSALAEPALFLGLAAIARETGSMSLSGMFAGITGLTWFDSGVALALIVAALSIVFLAENARIPVDDPNTHLELTMIHEVMVLDHGGPDFAAILYSSALKLWLFGTLIVNVTCPVTGVFAALGFGAGMLLLAVLTGIIESVMARLSLLKVPQLLIGASMLSLLAFILMVRFIA